MRIAAVTTCLAWTRWHKTKFIVLRRWIKHRRLREPRHPLHVLLPLRRGANRRDILVPRQAPLRLQLRFANIPILVIILLWILKLPLLVELLLVRDGLRESRLYAALRVLTIRVNVILHGWIADLHIGWLAWPVAGSVDGGGGDVGVGDVHFFVLGELGGLVDLLVVEVCGGFRLSGFYFAVEGLNFGELVGDEALGDEEVGVGGVVVLVHQKQNYYLQILLTGDGKRLKLNLYVGGFYKKYSKEFQF